MRHGLRFESPEEKPEITKEFLWRIASYLAPYKGLLGVVIGLILAVSVLGLAPPLLLRSVIDQALPNKDFNQLLLLVLLSIGATGLVNLLQVGQSYLTTKLSKGITFGMKNQMYQHLQGMSLRFFSTEKPGEISTRLNSDIDGVQDVFQSTIVSLLTSVFTLGTTLIALFSMNWKLALLALATIPLYILPTRRVGKHRWQITKQRQELVSAQNQQVQESLSISGSTLMKVFTTEEAEYQQFETLNGQVVELQMQEALSGRWFRMTMTMLSTAGPLLVYLFGGLLYIRGELSIGLILTFATLLNRLYGPVMQLSNLHIDTTRSLALFQRIFEYFDLPQEIADHPEATLLEPETGEIIFDQVNFSYGEGKETLKTMSFTAPGGKTTALVGSSGAGKTTITNLIPRLYETGSGQILVDGQNIQQLTLASLRGQIGIVTQEPYLFNGTIAENLAYGCGEPTQPQLEEAAKAAYIHDFIQSLPKGYQTVVGNRGIKLSGGEKQRISIARVILKNPSILILDEATSALDSVSEQMVQKAMDPLMEGRTSIVIAHRLSTIQNAHQILVIEQGEIVERGTHHQLLQEEGVYTNLYQKQFLKGLEQAS